LEPETNLRQTTVQPMSGDDDQRPTPTDSSQQTMSRATRECDVIRQ